MNISGTVRFPNSGIYKSFHVTLITLFLIVKLSFYTFYILVISFPFFMFTDYRIPIRVVRSFNYFKLKFITLCERVRSVTLFNLFRY